MSHSTELRVYNSNTGVTHLTGGFSGSLKDKSDVDSILKTFRNLSRLVPDISESTKWDDVAHYHGCMFVAALEEMSQGNNGLMNAFVINRLCAIVKENLAPTYVKGTNRFQQHLDVFRSQGFKAVRNRLHDKVNLGAQVLEDEYPARINIDWLASAAASLNDLPMEYYDFQRHYLYSLPEMCDEKLIQRWLTISDSPTDLLVTLGVEDALHNAHHVITDSDQFGAFLNSLRALLAGLKADIPYSDLSLFDAEMRDEDFEEDDDEDSFDVIDEGSDSDDEDEEEDEGEDLDVGFNDDDEEEDEGEDLDVGFNDDEDDDGEEDDDESLSSLFTGDDEEDLNDELDDIEDEEEDDWEESEVEEIIQDNPVVVYRLLSMVVGQDNMDKAIRDYVNTNIDGQRVDEGFSPMSNVILNSAMTSSDVCEAFANDFVGITRSSAWNLVSCVGAAPTVSDRILEKIGLATKYESMSDVFSTDNGDSERLLPMVTEAITKSLLSTDFSVEIRGLSDSDKRELLNSVQGHDVTDLEMPRVMEMLRKVSPQKLVEGLISMNNKTGEGQNQADVMVSSEVRELTATIIKTLGKATLSQNVDYRIDLNDLCEAVDNFELPLDPAFRHFLLESIKEMLTEKYGEVIVNSQFDLRGVFFKFIAVELDTKNTQTISLLEILTSHDEECSEPEDSSAVVQEEDEEVAGDENYALKS